MRLFKEEEFTLVVVYLFKSTFCSLSLSRGVPETGRYTNKTHRELPIEGVLPLSVANWKDLLSGH